MKLINQPKPGTISWGTLRNQDLLPRFIEAIEYYTGKRPEWFDEIPTEAWEDLESLIPNEKHEFWNSYDCSCFINEDAFDALVEIAAQAEIPNLYFGSHPGDGSDFGFWTFEDGEF